MRTRPEAVVPGRATRRGGGAAARRAAVAAIAAMLAVTGAALGAGGCGRKATPGGAGSAGGSAATGAEAAGGGSDHERDGDAGLPERGDRGGPADADAADRAADPAAAARSTGPIAIERIAVHTDVAALDDAALAATLRAAMLDSGAFVPAPERAAGLAAPAGGPPRARVELTVAATVRAGEHGAPPTAVVATEVELRFVPERAEPAPHAHVAAQRPLAGGAAAHPDDGVRALADDVVTAAAHALAARRAEALAPGDALGPLLASADDEQVLWGLELAGARRARDQLRAITPLLARKGPVHDAAVTALVAIGDPAAVAAIASAVDFEDKDALATAIEAAIALGGPDADDFLELIASGHHDAELAARAREGLARLARRPDARAP